MKKHLACAGWLLLCGLSLGAGEQTLILREPVRRQWRRELVRFPFAAGSGECRPDSVRLTGPAGPVPVQLTQIEFWPKTDSVKAARLTFIADLAPLAEDAYVVRFGQDPAPEPSPLSDLAITTTDGTVTLRTSSFGVTLRQGSEAAQPGEGAVASRGYGDRVTV